MNYNPKDYYFKKAKAENFVARSIFKLEEIDQKFKMIKTGDQILDLGAAPGSWSQYCSKKIGDKGRVLAVDLQESKVALPNVTFIQADLRDLNLEATFSKHGFATHFDVVISDMAPKTTGIRMTDQARSMELCELALSVADRHLTRGGHFVCKFFHSGDFNLLRDQMKKVFSRVEAMKPDSTRKISKEIFLIGLKKK